MKKTILFFAICLQAISLSAQTTKTLSKAAYSVKYPDTWTVESTTGAKQFTVSAPSDGEGDTFAEFANMVSYATPGYTSKTYGIYSKGYLPQKVKNFKVLEEKEFKQGGKDAYYIVFTGKQDGQSLKWKQVYIIINGYGYVLTFAAQPDKYAQYSKTFSQILSSFVIK